MSQYWTAVIVRDGQYECRDHFGSFSPQAAKSELELSIPLGSDIVALIPGRHAQNAVTFSAKTPTLDSVRFINPYDVVKD